MQQQKTDKEACQRNLDEVFELLGKEHKAALQMCQIIREGIRSEISFQRIKKYADWYYKNQLAPHLKKERAYVFPILGEESELIKKTLAKQRRLKRLFNEEREIEKSLNRIEEELEGLIRLNEKKIFKEIALRATEDQLIEIKKAYQNAPETKVWNDVFWHE